MKRVRGEVGESKRQRQRDGGVGGEARHPHLEEMEPSNLLRRGFQGFGEQVGNLP